MVAEMVTVLVAEAVALEELELQLPEVLAALEALQR
jgi:hypothetical protein